MGCGMSALVESDTLPALLADVPKWFEEWEQVLSRFRIDSELSELNRKAGAPVVVSETLWDVFVASLEAVKQTDGLVNPLVLDALVEAGYAESFDATKAGASVFLLEFPPVVPSVAAITSDAASRTICLPDGAHLDFGGIAKGWCAHQTAQRLLEIGPAFVCAGGDIAMSASPVEDGEWSIGIEDPFEPVNDVEMVYVTSGGVATSARNYRRWIRQGMPQHHIIDPRIGTPAETDIMSATVIAPTVMEAEAAAKAVLISGSQAGLEWLESNHTLAGLLILANGQKLSSRNFEKYL